jgi:hypothetical protein
MRLKSSAASSASASGLREEVHVRAGLLLRRAVAQFAREGAGVRRIDDHQLADLLRERVGVAPGEGAAPVVGDQRGHRAVGAFGGDELLDVLDQQVGLVLGHLGGRAGFFEAAQVGRHAAVAAVRGFREVFEQLVPDERGLGKAVQEHHQRLARLAGRAAAQGGAVGQAALEGLDHASRLLGLTVAIVLIVNEAGMDGQCSRSASGVFRWLRCRLRFRCRRSCRLRGAPTATAAGPRRRRPASSAPRTV